MTRSDFATLLRQALRLVPVLIRHDPLFRYAGIAAALFLLVLIGRGLQDWAGPGPIPPAPDPLAVNTPRSPTSKSPAPEPTMVVPAPLPAPPIFITPGRKLDGVTVTPAPADRFGTLPQGNKNP